jgi:hypothetical protein
MRRVFFSLLPALMMAAFNAYAQDYDALKKEIKANELAGKGDVSRQTQNLFDEGERLNTDAEILERENAGLLQDLVKVQKAVDWWNVICREDLEFIVANTTMGGEPWMLRIPKESRFPGEYTGYRWESKIAFKDALLDTFRRKDMQYKHNDSNTGYITEFTPLMGVLSEEKWIAEVSMLVKYPSIDGYPYYSIQYLLRFKRSYKDTWVRDAPEIPKTVERCSKDFVKNFVKELEANGEGSPK